MSSPNHAAAVLLAAGDPLGALSLVGRGDSPEALALCGCAFAQLGDLERAKRLLTRAGRGFGSSEPLARARCVAAIAEVSLAARDLSLSLAGLRHSVSVFAAHGDLVNALHARLVLARILMMCGRRVDAEQVLAGLSVRRAPAQLVASFELIGAELALRRVEVSVARAGLVRGLKAARRAGVAALERELARMQEGLLTPAARLVVCGAGAGHGADAAPTGVPEPPRVLTLLEVERVLARAVWLADVCRRELRCGARRVSFARKPVLFQLLCCLAEAWPGGATREQLIARGFGVRRGNESHRSRLRVELGRLRHQLGSMGAVEADGQGYRLVAAVSGSAGVALLLPPVDGEHAALLALLGDGGSWSSSALALALGMSQRTLQRALLSLEQGGRVCGRGQGRARRWSVLPQWALEPLLFGLLAL
jgi:DNA-binding transcriptional ArsR family regulator